MPKPLKSQWEFGELFPTEAVQKVLTVSELTGSIRRVLEKEVGQVWVTGEITNLRVQASGHVYFTLKDATAQLGCVLFRNEARSVNRDYLQDGQKVILQGELTVYEARGQYQLRVSSVQLQGLGALQAAFERLKQKLQGEGLFDQTHKRPLPRFPQVIGVVTSPDGAAIRDVLHTIQRRNPALQVILACCRVQGVGAAKEIAAAIHMLNEWSGHPHKLDLILLTRGGGSLEDLWAFNEEIVARAIYASGLPIVSAVGHEIDFTISDFVADFRAATPTAGAEIITEGIYAKRGFLENAAALLSGLTRDSLEAKRQELMAHQRIMARVHPRRRLAEQYQKTDDLHHALLRCTRHHLRRSQERAQQQFARFIRLRPRMLLLQRHEYLQELSSRLRQLASAEFARARARLEKNEAELRLLSPLNVLERGYSITTRAGTGEIVRNASQVKPGEEIVSKVRSGEIRSTVT